MGGSGSTRWGCHSKKDTVEECLVLSANQMMREGTLRQGILKSGGWSWVNSYTQEQASSIGYEVDATKLHSSWLRLHYVLTNSKGRVDYKIRLTLTRPNFGGLRWWFMCPLSVNGRMCNRRVAKIYLPPGG